MPNELKFEVEFTRAQIEDLLSDSSVAYINISGSYAHMGQNSWSTLAQATGVDDKKERTAAPGKDAECIKPC